MIQYRCNHCDGLLCGSSVCPVCGERTELIKTDVFYCKKCNAPVFFDKCLECNSDCERIGSDIRPVFAEERLLIEVLLGQPMAFAGKAVWSTQSNTYWVDGERKTVSLTELRKQDPQNVIKQLNAYAKANQPFVDENTTNIHIKNFVNANKIRLNDITDEACNYIKKISSDFDLESMFVSFSGGKDSTVTSNLVMKALGTEKIIHIYGDTTLEYPESKKYLETFRSQYRETPVLVAKNSDQNFNDLCNVVGPPSRVLRWCCTVFKTGAIAKKIEQIFSGKNRILSFQGIRRIESSSRSKYDRDSINSKITKQVASSPIIDWLDFDVWLYILANNLPFNNAYCQGFSRVGCWCCPNNSGWSEYLSSIYMADEYKAFHEILYSFARKVGKEDWKDYVDDGKWKARQGGNGLELGEKTFVEFKPCALESDAYNFDLTKPIDDSLYVLFKPFGNLDFELGNKRLNEVYVVDRKTSEPILRLSGRKGQSVLRITVLRKKAPFNYEKTTEQVLKNQITKYQTCIGCSYCQSVCRFNALKVVNTNPGAVSNQSIQYTIDSSRCVGCLECVKHFDNGCYMKKVLRVKRTNNDDN